MLWEVEIRPAPGQTDREATRVRSEAAAFGARTLGEVRTAHSFLIQGELDEAAVRRIADELLVDAVVERSEVRPLTGASPATGYEPRTTNLLSVLYKPGVTNNVADSAKQAMRQLGLEVEAVATCRKYDFDAEADRAELERIARKVLANEAVEQIVWGPLPMDRISLGSEYRFHLITVPIRGMNDAELTDLSRTGQLYLSLPEMQTIRQHFTEQQRDPTDAELETLAQTWSEHCSHKTLRGRIRYREWVSEDGGWRIENGESQERPGANPPPSTFHPRSSTLHPSSAPPTREIQFENLLKETIFAATAEIRQRLGADDWCVSVFRDNAGIVKFDERQNVCMKVETHNHPSALEPYGGANTGLGGVIRDPLGTGLGARPVCNTDVFCFAPPDMPDDALPPGVLHPRVVMKGVVAGVRDYGNRMGIPTVNGAVFFDERYLGNPLVYCGNVAMIPADKCDKHVRPGDLIVAVGGRTGRDGIHGATFSSAELTDQSETVYGGAVQIGNAITEKMVMDVILQARDRGLYSAITDCGAGGFSSAVGEMGEESGAEVWLDRAPLKYAGLSYTEIWISEAQERMVLSVSPEQWPEFQQLCASEGVEATTIGRFTDTRRLVLKYHDHQVADLSMDFLHNGRPPVVREAVYVQPPLSPPLDKGGPGG